LLCCSSSESCFSGFLRFPWKHDCVSSFDICWDQHSFVCVIHHIVFYIEETTKQLWSLCSSIVGWRNFKEEKSFQFRKTYTFSRLGC
jgi:hypothetical protein